MPNIREAFETLVNTGDLSVIDRIDLPARTERRLAIPEAYMRGPIRQLLTSVDKSGEGLWHHQSLALEHAAAGRNVIISTGTASGKSLVFQAAGLQIVQDDPSARVLVFYPLKALAADQMISWRDAASNLGLPSETVGMIHGGVPADERLQVLEQARIVVMTPDVFHAWFMRQVSAIPFRRFLADLRLLVIDEAHVLEAVFGSNVAFLLRRMQAARSLAAHARADVHPLQIIAASATILDPAGHMEALTGQPFSCVGEDDDGSPSHERCLMHIGASDVTQEMVCGVLNELLSLSESGSFITFADSRQGVERIADTLGHSGVRPYRSGYEERDRTVIEHALRDGALRGVVSTSALELGINIAHFAVGLNVDVPDSKKAFRQRVGRVGRAQPGTFALIADPAAFRRLGSTFQEYWQGTVEPSHLYLENRFMQFAHARCLWDELEGLGARQPVPPANVNWPNGFREVYDFARPGGARPREFDPINQLGGDEPHFNYPLRNVGEASFRLRGTHGGADDGVGFINLQQAIRETYPGAVYLHMARRYFVVEWRNTAFERTIRLANTQRPPITRPLIRTFVNAAVDNQGIVAGHFLSSEAGFLCECELQITERVEGYRDGGTNKLYRDLRQHSPAMVAKMRDFRTTGVVMRIAEPWIQEPGIKQRMADALRELMVREYSISPQDIGAVATNIALVRNGLREPVSDAIVVYDGTYGSLRLTEPLFTSIEALISRLIRAFELADDEEAPLPRAVVEKLLGWYSGLASAELEPATVGRVPEGFIQVLKPGSRVSMYDTKGVLRDIEIVTPEIIDPQALGLEGDVKLVYQYLLDGTPPGVGVRRIPDERVERTGDEWSWILWSPSTGEFREEPED